MDALEVVVRRRLYGSHSHAGPGMDFGLSKQEGHLLKIPTVLASYNDLEFLRLNLAFCESQFHTWTHQALALALEDQQDTHIQPVISSKLYSLV